MNIPKTLALAAIPLLITASGASAQSATFDDDADESVITNDEAATTPADADADLLDGNATRVIVRDRDGPAVYGWQGCGTYFYWNGETCVDARAAPSDR